MSDKIREQLAAFVECEPPIIMYPALNEMTGSLNTSYLLSYLMQRFRESRGEPFHTNDKEMMIRLGFTQAQITYAKNKLKRKSLISIKRVGLPPKSFYTVNHEKIDAFINSINEGGNE